MNKFLCLATFGIVLADVSAAPAQEGPVPTQMLVGVDAKSAVPARAADLTVAINNHKEPLSAWVPVVPANAQVALLIDDGLRESVGRELNTLKKFVQSLPPGTEVLIGYMQNGRIVQAQPFTTDHAAAAAALRLPEGVAGTSASPYFCLSDFVKKWPGEDGAGASSDGAPVIARGTAAAPARKARFVLMITNGVDPYNGSTSLANQDSPYVESAVTDAQRAGVAVYSIYYSDAGFRGGGASFSGQSYLQQVGDGTGGRLYYEGTGNPVSMQPFLQQFQRALADTYIATFDAPRGKDAKDLVHVKLVSDDKAKLHAPDMVLPGNAE